jgi:hypothetical protein
MRTERVLEATHLTEADDGQRRIVYQWVTLLLFENESTGRTQRHKGHREWALSDKSEVRYRDENTFQIVKTDTILRKVGDS